MPLPFKERPNLPNNKQQALIRLNHLKIKLQRDKEYKERYTKFMKEVTERGEVEEVHDQGTICTIFLQVRRNMVHSASPSLIKSDKVRVVFDCSVKCKGTSLNDHLLSSPDLLNNLNGVLIRHTLWH